MINTLLQKDLARALFRAQPALGQPQIGKSSRRTGEVPTGEVVGRPVRSAGARGPWLGNLAGHQPTAQAMRPPDLPSVKQTGHPVARWAGKRLDGASTYGQGCDGAAAVDDEPEGAR